MPGGISWQIARKYDVYLKVLHIVDMLVLLKNKAWGLQPKELVLPDHAIVEEVFLV